MIGQIICDRYHVEALVGRGGMGAVYRATDLTENRAVALKVMHFFLDYETDIARTRFNREFRVLARLDHPNIVQAYDHGTYENAPYLILEFLTGETLSEEIAAGPIKRERLLMIARQICEALVHLHTQAIVHRDLKPGNLMLQNGDNPLQVKLMDFGLVRNNDLSMQLTQEGVALGTVAYMAPEQAQGLPVDFRADLYALGTILYEMATGRPPFVHQNPAVILMQQLTTAPLLPRQLNPNLDEALEQLILDLLEKEPAQRPFNAEAVISRLAALANESVPIISASPHKRTDVIPRIPLVGRSSSLQALSQRWAEVQAGQGQVILLSGVAGVGKTRLLTEASLPIRIGTGHFISGHCREHASLPYQPLLDMLDSLLANFSSTIRQSLPAELSKLLPDSSSADADEPAAGNDPAGARLRLFSGYWEALRQGAQEQPLMLAIEDIQWADPTALELISYLVQRVQQASILLILSYRPEEIESGMRLAVQLPDVQRSDAAHAIALELFTREQVTDFLQAALRQESVPPALVESFYLATDGNPLFIEETLKALAAEGQVSQLTANTTSSHSTRVSTMALQLPQNVLALAERRLQLLADEDRPILTAAAVLGPEFSFAMLETVAKVDEDTLLDAIDRLLAAHLIDELPLQDGEDRYRFTQEALRQALLKTISQRRLRRLHARVGETIKKIYDTRQPRHWPVLAHHFMEAGDLQQALKYFIQAADGAAGMYASAEAAIYCQHGIDIIKSDQRLESDIDSDQLKHLYTQRGRSLELSSQFEEALDNYKEMASLAQKRDDKALELAALIAHGIVIATPTTVQDLAQAPPLLEQALSLSRQLGDREAEAKALWALLLAYKFTDASDKALAYGEQSLAIARELDLREQMAFTLNDIAWVYMTVGQNERVQPALNEARELWREIGNLPMLADNLYSSGGLCALAGDFEQALELLQEALPLSERIGNLWGQANSWSLMGYAYLEFGQFAEALQAIEETLRLSELGGVLYLQITAQADLGWIYGNLGAIERAIEIGQEAQSKAKTLASGWGGYPAAMLARLYLLNNDVAAAEAAVEQGLESIELADTSSFGVLWVTLAKGELALTKGDYAQALSTVNQLIKRLDQLELRAYISDALQLKAAALFAQDQIDEALQVLNRARAEADSVGSRRSKWPILALASQIEAQRGNASEAEALHHQAQEIIKYIADHTPPEFRSSFLNLPHVRTVMEEE